MKSGENQVIPQRPVQLWVADITYLPVQQGEAYLSLATDAWSRKTVGYHEHDNLSTNSVMLAYSKALKTRKDERISLIHHSDRGIQYCSKQYQHLNETHGVRCSMTDSYLVKQCFLYQNALAERVNGILKNEYLLHKPRDIQEVAKRVAESVEIYNGRRPPFVSKIQNAR